MAPKKRKSAAQKCVVSKKTKQNDYTSSWFEAVTEYVRETQTTVLDLAESGLQKKEERLILNFLPDTQISELKLGGNFLRNSVPDLAPLLIKTKLVKLSIVEPRSTLYRQVDRETTEGLLVLFEVLKDTQIKDLSIQIRWFDELHFNTDEAEKLVSHLRKSKLVMLDSDLIHSFPPSGLASIFRDYLKTTITSLNLGLRPVDSTDLVSLFANLSDSSVTDLDLRRTKISPEALIELSKQLAKTKIEKLNLAENKLRTDQLDILVEGLVGSKVTDLNLHSNNFKSVSVLLTRLKDTEIRTLDLHFNWRLRNEHQVFPTLQHSSLTALKLGSCDLSDESGENLMESLRLSNVTKLDISHNNVGLLTINKFAENVKDFNLTDLNLSRSPLSWEAFSALGECLIESKLVCISVGGTRLLMGAGHFILFLQITEGSPVRQITMNYCDVSVWEGLPLCKPKMLLNTTFTELDLTESNIGNNISSLISHLKYTAVVHLNLTRNGISDDGVIAVAESLKESQIRRLNLNKNAITNQGAEALALSLKESNLLYLHLKNNKIGNEGLQSLAENAKDTLVSVIDVLYNPGKKIFLVDKILWRNRLLVHKFVNTYKQIAPQTDADEFRFSQDSDDLEVSVLLEKFMRFYRNIIHDSRAVGVLLEDESVTFSREQIFRLLFEEFPRQFSEFIACRIEASLTEHVNILEKAEEMGLTAVVESLLLNRPVYTLDEEQGILHPYVYKLLIKYKQPVCNLAVEPQGVVKITEYFTTHADIEGAQELINLLQNAKIS